MSRLEKLKQDIPTLFVTLTIRFIPKEIWKRNREQAVNLRENGKPKKWYYFIPIVLLWGGIIFLIVKTIFL